MQLEKKFEKYPYLISKTITMKLKLLHLLMLILAQKEVAFKFGKVMTRIRIKLKIRMTELSSMLLDFEHTHSNVTFSYILYSAAYIPI